MGEVLGADPDQLEALAGRFERRAAELASSRSSLTSMLTSVPWVGADADRFRSTWRREQSRHLDLVVDELREMAASLRREAADQRSTSGGAALGSGPRDGSATSVGPAGGPDEVAHGAVGAIDQTSRGVRRVMAGASGPTLADLGGTDGPGARPVPPLLDDPGAAAPPAEASSLPRLDDGSWTPPVRDPEVVRRTLAGWW